MADIVPVSSSQHVAARTWFLIVAIADAVLAAGAIFVGSFLIYQTCTGLAKSSEPAEFGAGMIVSGTAILLIFVGGLVALASLVCALFYRRAKTEKRLSSWSWAFLLIAFAPIGAVFISIMIFLARAPR